MWCCEPKPKVRQQTKAEKAAGLLPVGPVLYGKRSIFGSAVGLKRHRAWCAEQCWAMARWAMARKTRAAAAAAAAIAPVKMEGDGVEDRDTGFVDSFKYFGSHFESGGDRWHHVEIRMAMAASAIGRLRHIWVD